MEEEKQAFFVESVDGRKFKMVIRGDLAKLSVTKIKRYLKSYGVPDDQQLQYHGQPLAEEMTGKDFGLANDSVLQLYDPAASPHHQQQRKEASSSQHRTAGERRAESAGAPKGFTMSSGGGVGGGGGGGSALLSSLSGPRPAWATAGSPDSAPRPSSSSVSRPSDEVQQLRDALAHAEAEKHDLEQQVQQLKKQNSTSSGGSRAAPAASTVDPLQNVQQNLKLLGQHLQTELTLDSTTLTCAIGADDAFTILVTFDPPTERLYIYATLLNEEGHAVFSNAAYFHKLCEVCLEGALLGREVCGGGIGLSRQNEMVVLSTSLLMTCSTERALLETMPAFVESLTRWRELLQGLLTS